LGNLEAAMPKNPYRSTPIVLNNELTDYSQVEARKLSVDSAEWFTWLEGASRFAYQVWISAPIESFVTLTFRREARQRGGMYWIAYAKDKAGKRHKVYAGRSDTLDAERLKAVGQLMLGKLLLSYPTTQAEPIPAKAIFEPKPRRSRAQRSKQPTYPPLTRAELEPSY
jgi:hypothetical protein